MEKFYVGAKDRKYLPIAIGMETQPFKYRLMDKEMFMQKMEYIHNKPVKAGLCAYPEDYKYSSAKFYETGEDEFGIMTHWMA